MYTLKYSKNRNNYAGPSKKVNRQKFAEGGFVNSFMDSFKKFKTKDPATPSNAKSKTTATNSDGDIEVEV